MDLLTVARGQGAFLTVNGLWPLLQMRSFEAVFGSKTDRWPVRSVAGLMVTIGVTQLSTSVQPGSVRQAALLGVGTAVTLGGIDLTYAPSGRIRRTYLLDAVAEAAWLALWARARRRSSGRP